MRKVPFIFHAMFCADKIAAHFESVVDRIDYDRLEFVIAVGNELAGVKKILPLVSWNLEYLKVIETWLAFEEDRIGRLARHFRLSDFGASIK